MPVTHTNRRGKTYYLHTGPRRGGGIQHYFSTKPAGPLAGSITDGYWISIGPPESAVKLAGKYLKHLGQDSFYELF